jgi:hypothetical protein
MNPDDLPENVGRPMPEPDRLTVEDQYTMAAITGLLASGKHCDFLMLAEPRRKLIRRAKAVARQAMEAR